MTDRSMRCCRIRLVRHSGSSLLSHDTCPLLLQWLLRQQNCSFEILLEMFPLGLCVQWSVPLHWAKRLCCRYRSAFILLLAVLLPRLLLASARTCCCSLPLVADDDADLMSNLLFEFGSSQSAFVISCDAGAAACDDDAAGVSMLHLTLFLVISHHLRSQRLIDHITSLFFDPIFLLLAE